MNTITELEIKDLYYAFCAHNYKNEDATKWDVSTNLGKAAYNNSADKKQNMQHQFDLKKRDEIYLNIDYGMMGIGGDNSWGDEPHLIYQLLPHEYYYNYTIKPFSVQD